MSLWTIPTNYGLIIEELYGITLFITLYNLGNLIVKVKFGLGRVMEKIFDFIGGLSFQSFLLQHVVIAKSQRLYNPTSVADYWKMLSLTVVITIAGAYCLKRVSILLIHTMGYQKFENYILK